jgi:ABC-2 type transport system permease protein
MKHILRIAGLEMRFLLRDKMALFFTFFFPFFLLFLFGSIWGKIPGYYGMLMPMIIAMAALSGGLFGIGIGLTSYRETGIFRRLSLTPLTSRAYILGTLLCRFTVLLGESAVLLAIMTGPLRQPIRGSLVTMGLFVVIGLLAMLALGTLIATLARNTEAAIAIGNIVFTPGMFLSGGFIPLSILPPFMQKAAVISPMHHMIAAMQTIILRPHGIGPNLGSLAYLTVFFVACALLSRRLFSAE